MDVYADSRKAAFYAVGIGDELSENAAQLFFASENFVLPPFAAQYGVDALIDRAGEFCRRFGKSVGEKQLDI